MPGLIPDESWLGRVFEANAFETLGVNAGLWAVVTKCGDRADGDEADAPLKGLRIVMYNEESEARIVAARALKQVRGARNLTEVQRRYAQGRPAAAELTLQAVSAKDAGKMGGNRSAARQYWAELEAAEARERRPAAEPDSERLSPAPPLSEVPELPPDEAAAPAGAAESSEAPSEAPGFTPGEQPTAPPGEQDWPQWCVEAGGERGPFSLRLIELGRAFGGTATVGGRTTAFDGDAYFVRLHTGAVVTFPEAVIACALHSATPASAVAWLQPGGSRGGGVQVAPYKTIASVVLGPMLKAHTPGKTIVAAAALRELAVASGAPISKLGLPAADESLSSEDGARIAVALEFRLMRLFQGHDLSAESLEASPSPLKRNMRRRASAAPPTPGSSSRTANGGAACIDVEQTPRVRKRPHKRVSFCDDESDSGDAVESITDTLTMALDDSEFASFARDAIALLRLDISAEHAGRSTEALCYGLVATAVKCESV